MKSLIFLMLIHIIAGEKLRRASNNESSPIFSWNSDILSNAVTNQDETMLYSIFPLQNGTTLVTVNISNPLNFSYTSVKLSFPIESLAGVLWNGNFGFTNSLNVFSFSDLRTISSVNLKEPFIMKYGPIKNTILIFQDSSVSLYLFTPVSGLTRISNVTVNLRGMLSAKTIIVSKKGDTIFYSIIQENEGFFLKTIDYVSGEITRTIKLPDGFNYSLSTTVMETSHMEDFISLYVDGTLLFYKNQRNYTTLIANMTISLSAVRVLSQGNLLIGKLEQTNQVYLISMEKGIVTAKMSVKENDYLNCIYVRPWEGKTIVIFSDYLNWYGYELETTDQENMQVTVNAYVVLMAAILTVAMIASIIYILCKRKSNLAQGQQQSQIQNPVQNSAGGLNGSQRRDIYQVAPPRTLETRIITDLNESGINLPHLNEGSVRKVFSCPLTGLKLKNPVIAMDGYTYEKEAIEQWFQQNEISPTTQEPLRDKTLIPNKTIANFLSGSH